MIDPDYELRYVVRVSDPNGFLSDPNGCVEFTHDVRFSSLDEAKGYCREHSQASEGLLSYRLFDYFDGVELDY